MSAPASTAPSSQSIGGRSGHWLRRTVHLSMAGIPWLYYWQGQTVAAFCNDAVPALGFLWTPDRLVTLLVLLLLGVEVVRLASGGSWLGYRHYEQRRLSAMAWGSFAVALTLLLAPDAGVMGAAYGLPLILTMSLGDPLLGEMRTRTKLSPRLIVLIAVALLLVLWWACSLWLGTPAWLALLVVPVAVATERIELGWMDDNGSMLLAPLVLVLLLAPWL